MKTENNDVSAVNHPPHYNRFSHEVIELVEKMSFCNGNALKYLLRAPFKGHYIEDLQKAAWYLRRIDRFDITDEQMKMIDQFSDEMLEHSPDMSLMLHFITPTGRTHLIALELDDIIKGAEEEK